MTDARLMEADAWDANEAQWRADDVADSYPDEVDREQESDALAWWRSQQ